MSKRFYITTAIDYVNGEPHVGHAYEKVIADVIARARRSLGADVFFLTGVDEHAAVWRDTAKKLELTIDDFVRTTDPRHKEVLQAILSKLNATGHFYKAV